MKITRYSRQMAAASEIGRWRLPMRMRRRIGGIAGAST
jgi:hypothetical protein